MARGTVAELVKNTIAVRLLHLRVDIEARVAQLCDFFGQKLHACEEGKKQQTAEKKVKHMLTSMTAKRQTRKTCRKNNKHHDGHFFHLQNTSADHGHKLGANKASTATLVTWDYTTNVHMKKYLIEHTKVNNASSRLTELQNMMDWLTSSLENSVLRQCTF